MPNPSAAARSGLYTTEASPVPLAGVAIAAEISNFCARVSVTQRYVNRESSPIEAVYLFPLEEGAAVCGFEAIIDGTLVIGEVKEREQAFRLYDDAIELGHGAFLLDEERPDVFQASIGNLPAGKEVLLKLTYVSELAVDGASLRFSLPTTVSPRYAPAEDHTGIGRPDAQALNPPVAWSVPYGLDLSIGLTMPGTISRIESVSHPVSVTLHGRSAEVRLASRQVALDRDFVLSIDAEGIDRPQVWLERDDQGGQAIAVAFIPHLDQRLVPSELIFLVDRSGSMKGTSIEEVRNALQLCLRSMIPGCRFNIVGFGSSFESLFPESRAYDETSLSAASAHVSNMKADLGGTEILPALESVLQYGASQTLPRQVVVMTDGEVTNTDAVMALAQRHASNTRIFAFGIGAGASHHLVSGLARNGRGIAEFVYPGERIEPKVLRQFGRLLSPALTNVRMTWGGLDVTPAPSAPPAVFSGSRLLLYGLMRDIKAATLTLSVDAPEGPLTFELPVDPAAVSTGRTVGTLAARARIRELEESPAWIRPRGSRQRDRKQTNATEEIVSLSMRYGLMSRATSFVAIERREAPVHGDVKLRRVPVALTTGWGGHEAMALASVPLMDGSAMGISAFDPPPSPLIAKRVLGATPRRSLLSPRRFRWGRGSSDSAPSPSGVSRSPLYRIVKLQHANGSWDLSRELAEAMELDLAGLEASIPNAAGERALVRSAWATALALAWLHEHATDAEDEWRLLVGKARAWLDAVGLAPADGRTWTEAAAAFLSRAEV